MPSFGSAAGGPETRGNRARALAVVLVTALALVAGCDQGGEPSALPTGSARDYCAELGFVDGEGRNDAGELVAECHAETTPSGAAYSIARYLDADGPADKDDAVRVELTEYDQNGNEVNRTYGTLDGS